MRAYGHKLVDAAYQADCTLDALVAALRVLLKPSKAMRDALRNPHWSVGPLDIWRAGVKAAIKELEG